MDKQAQYAALASARKAYDLAPLGLINPSAPEHARFDSPHIGPWTRWAHDLNAQLMIVGQDWGDEHYFVENQGFDKARNPTNVV